ncbi:MAG: hypothetical protein AAF329_00405 [Cyanobacteria bacterium P01_A01_bin.17]
MTISSAISANNRSLTLAGANKMLSAVGLQIERRQFSYAVDTGTCIIEHATITETAQATLRWLADVNPWCEDLGLAPTGTEILVELEDGDHAIAVYAPEHGGWGARTDNGGWLIKPPKRWRLVHF